MRVDKSPTLREEGVEDMESLFLRPIDAAKLLNVSRSRVYELLNAGSLPATRLEGRTWRIPKAAIEKMVADAMSGTDSESAK
jgi:excisionase family DNA binding protein